MQLSVLESAITTAWTRGWQPADLAGYLRRKAGTQGERLVADLIATEMRRYAPTTVDPHWQSQLSAEVWWASEEEFLRRWPERQRNQMFVLLSRLPTLPVLCALPGQARPGASAVQIDPRMLDRVRALLAKAESTDFPEEAETYSAKAQELMARHSIDYALLMASRGTREAASGRRIQVDNPYESPKALLLSITAQANRSRSIWSRDLGFATVLGFPADVAAAELLYTSLLVQATSAMVHAGTPADRRVASFRRSFLTGYAHRIDQRLQQATAAASESAEREHGRAMLPVLASRAEAVTEAVKEHFPDVITTKATVGNRAGWIAGQVAADRANLRTHHGALANN
ncbi:MAG TPA: hypothetical protein DGT23_05915 [Micromonosporaceae bacterium]|nr:hypothetical protein [Micromonosporaceae bacterium]